MQMKRHKECLFLISNNLHCLYCARTIRNVKQKQIRSTLLSSPKRISLKTTPKSRKKLIILQKRNNVLRRQKNRFEKQVSSLKKNLLNLQSEYSNISQKSIEEKLIEINCPVNQKIIVQEILSAAKVIC